MRRLRLWVLALATVLLAFAVQAAPLTRAQALKALEQPESATRLAGIERLAEIGRMDDVDRLLARLDDPDPHVRELAAAATWQIWSRSGDPAIDKLFARGMDQMEARALEDALATFSLDRQAQARLRRRLEQAGDDPLPARPTCSDSLKDCDEVLKRNPKHFGALSSAFRSICSSAIPISRSTSSAAPMAVNPNLEGAAAMIPVLEELLREQQPQRT